MSLGSVVAAAFFGASGSAGQNDSVAQALIRHMASAPATATPGEWISYRAQAGGERVSFWRFSAVGAEKDARRREALWIELELGHQPDLRAPLLQMKMLVARTEQANGERVTRLFVALGADPAQEISEDQLHRLLHLPQMAEPRLVATAGDSPSPDEIIRTGEEARLMTRAGTLLAIPIEIYFRGSLVERIWMSRRLPLLGLAKLEMPGTGYLMEVTGFGKGAAARMILPEQIDRAIRLEPVPQGAR